MFPVWGFMYTWAALTAGRGKMQNAAKSLLKHSYPERVSSAFRTGRLGEVEPTLKPYVYVDTYAFIELSLDALAKKLHKTQV